MSGFLTNLLFKSHDKCKLLNETDCEMLSFLTSLLFENRNKLTLHIEMCKVTSSCFLMDIFVKLLNDALFSKIYKRGNVDVRYSIITCLLHM